MNQDNDTKQTIDIDEIASNNPAIDADRFKEWRRKMSRIERLGLGADEPQSDKPLDKAPAVPNGLGLLRWGNLPKR